MKYTTKNRACCVMQRCVGCVCNSVHLFIPFIVAIASSVSGCSLEASEPRQSPPATVLCLFLPEGAASPYILEPTSSIPESAAFDAVCRCLLMESSFSRFQEATIG